MVSETFVTLYFPCFVTGEPDANVLQIFCNAPPPPEDEA